MAIRLHPHAQARLLERGAAEGEVVETVRSGETFPAKHGRTGSRRNFACKTIWRGREYQTKQLEVFAVQEDDDWLVITALVKFF